MPRIRTKLVMSLLALVGANPVPAVLRAQAPEKPRVLFLTPSPTEPKDSTYVVTLGDEVRKRLDSQLRHKISVIETEQVCTLLTESGFNCNVILSPTDAERLARGLQAAAYIYGRFWWNTQVPMLQYHLVDASGRSGLTGWQTVRGTPGDPPRRFAEEVVDSLDNEVRAAEDARDCTLRRDHQDYRDAIERAQKAFERYPNHAGAAICVAVVLEAQRASVDSQILMYERAVKGDSINERAWERLGRLYQERGDSLKALGAFRTLVEMNPEDRDRWRGVIAGYITVGQYDEARDLASEWLERHTDDLEIVRLKARACSEGQMWSCALETMAQEYQMDSALVGDTAFYGGVIGMAQEVGDNEAVLRWANEALEHTAERTPWLKAKASAFQKLDQPDSVIPIYRTLVRADSSDVPTAFALATALLERLTIDSSTVLDTTQLFEAEQLLDRLTRTSRDTAVVENSAVKYYEVGQKLVQGQKPADMAARFLEKSLQYDWLRRLQQPANFFLGWAMLIQTYQFDQRVLAAKSCDLVRQEAEMIRRGKEAIQIGRSVVESAAQQFLKQYNSLENRIPQLRKAFCQ